MWCSSPSALASLKADRRSAHSDRADLTHLSAVALALRRSESCANLLYGKVAHATIKARIMAAFAIVVALGPRCGIPRSR